MTGRPSAALLVALAAVQLADGAGFTHACAGRTAPLAAPAGLRAGYSYGWLDGGREALWIHFELAAGTWGAFGVRPAGGGSAGMAGLDIVAASADTGRLVDYAVARGFGPPQPDPAAGGAVLLTRETLPSGLVRITFARPFIAPPGGHTLAASQAVVIALATGEGTVDTWRGHGPARSTHQAVLRWCSDPASGLFATLPPAPPVMMPALVTPAPPTAVPEPESAPDTVAPAQAASSAPMPGPQLSPWPRAPPQLPPLFQVPPPSPSAGIGTLATNLSREPLVQPTPPPTEAVSMCLSGAECNATECLLSNAQAAQLAGAARADGGGGSPQVGAACVRDEACSAGSCAVTFSGLWPNATDRVRACTVEMGPCPALAAAGVEANAPAAVTVCLDAARTRCVGVLNATVCVLAQGYRQGLAAAAEADGASGADVAGECEYGRAACGLNCALAVRAAGAAADVLRTCLPGAEGGCPALAAEGLTGAAGPPPPDEEAQPVAWPWFAAGGTAAVLCVVGCVAWRTLRRREKMQRRGSAAPWAVPRSAAPSPLPSPRLVPCLTPEYDGNDYGGERNVFMPIIAPLGGHWSTPRPNSDTGMHRLPYSVESERRVPSAGRGARIGYAAIIAGRPSGRGRPYL